jgi:cytochrome c-type biogenesis protein CcmH/NrfF
MKVFILTHYTFDIVYYEHKMPLSTWIIWSLPFLFWITAGLLILKFPVTESDDGTRAIAEMDTEALRAEIGDGTTTKFMAVG